MLPTYTDPTYHRVTGVAANDVLNIRQEPTAASPIIGTFAPGAAPVEVISRRGGWGQVIVGEGNGWVSLRFLAEEKMTRVGESRIPAALVCVGTEPFWSLRFSEDDKATFRTQDSQEDTVLDVSTAKPVRGSRVHDFLWLHGPATSATAFIGRTFCSDGMSDRLYGHEMVFTLKTIGFSNGLQGCCYVPAP
ncbi:MAG: SH3 domain-containing protein [Pseudomonadota bacterium]